MISKKTPQVDLERYRTIFLLIGVAISLGLALTILEHKTAFYNQPASASTPEKAGIIDISIPITVRKTPSAEKPKPKPKAKIDYTKKPMLEPKTLGNSSAKPTLDLNALDTIEAGEPLELFDAKVIDLFFVERIARPMQCEALTDRDAQMTCLNNWIKQYLVKNVRYPNSARRIMQEERIYVEFIVDELGNIQSAKAKGAKSLALAAEAERVVKNFPTMAPAMQNQKPVKMRMVIPVNFKLQ